VAARWSFTGTHGGEWPAGIPPTHKQVTVEGTYTLRIADGKIVECWAQMDALGLMQQLGVIPPLG
jgi:predicted ester cyclase